MTRTNQEALTSQRWVAQQQWQSVCDPRDFAAQSLSAGPTLSLLCLDWTTNSYTTTTVHMHYTILLGAPIDKAIGAIMYGRWPVYRLPAVFSTFVVPRCAALRHDAPHRAAGSTVDRRWPLRSRTCFGLHGRIHQVSRHLQIGRQTCNLVLV